MELVRPDLEARVTGDAGELAEWEDQFVMACEALVRMSPTAMASISVTGRWKGIYGEARCLAKASKRIAITYGLRETVQMDGSSFTVHFMRRDGALPTTRGD
jgi:hypothetical protein